MAWDFSTDPEFQEKLDWVADFCENEIAPFDTVFPYAIRTSDPAVKAEVRNLQDKIKAQGLWAVFLDQELGGRGYGQLKHALLNETAGRYPGAWVFFGFQAPDTGIIFCPSAYGVDE